MLINICFGFMMFIVSLIEFSKHVQNEISAKVMPKAQNFTADFADRTDRRNCDPPRTPNYAERTTGPRSEVSVVRIFSVPQRDVTLTRAMCFTVSCALRTVPQVWLCQSPARPRTLHDIRNGRANTGVARDGLGLIRRGEILRHHRPQT